MGNTRNTMGLTVQHVDGMRFLGRRIAGTHALLAVSYRDDEVTATHPLRRVLGELPPASRSWCRPAGRCSPRMM